MTAFDYGFSNDLAATRLPSWYLKTNESINSGESQDPCSPSHAGSISYCSNIEKTHPGYLHELYRYAESVQGPTATLAELTSSMNAK